MDYETKIYFERFIDAVNDPDWWTIGITSVITIINAAIMVWLGVKQYQLQKQQTKLQERQTKQQEYDVYRNLYKVISDVNIEISNFLFTLYVRISTMPPKENGVHLFDKELTRVKMLDEHLLECVVDFRLKLPKEGAIISNHRNMLSLMFNAYNRLNDLYQKDILSNDAPLTQREDNFIKGFRDDDRVVARAILIHIKDAKVANLELMYIDQFVSNKNKLFEMNYLEKIGAQSKVE